MSYVAVFLKTEIMTHKELTEWLRANHADQRVSGWLRAQGHEMEAGARGFIPPGALLSKGQVNAIKAIGFTGKAMTVVGVGVSAWNIGQATAESYSSGSAVPLAGQVAQEVYTWGHAAMGATAGAGIGLLIGGPVGAVVGGFVGGVGGAIWGGWIGSQINERVREPYYDPNILP
ncbi:MAG: hypothetical protein KDK97_12435 [Verrucomicrobiales bacterium]|nr:hypothetical protein [Verrucomicrobiales bacterium]MCP5559104.1 hypothetical protein [Verrucomicrobiaceae bacterium]